MNSDRSGRLLSSQIFDDIPLAHALRRLNERSEAEKPFVPVVGGFRLFFLLLYASVILVASVEFFLSQEIWYGSWRVFNTYVFTVSGLFVLAGMLLLFSARKPRVGAEDDLPVPKLLLGILGIFMFGGGALGLVVGGGALGGAAVALSVLLLYGFVLMLLGSRSLVKEDCLRLAMYGTGLILMALVPVHEAFGVAESSLEEYPFTMLNLALLVPGATLALFAVQSLRTRDGFLGAWLMGAMIIFLIAFHEQIGILASGTYEPYDRSLALIGITFSFLPLTMYVWREREYISLWKDLREANAMIEREEYRSALKRADVAIEKSSKSAIVDRFSLPWTIKADVLYRMREYSKAKSHYDIALDIDPEDSVSWCHLGSIYAFNGKKDLALNAFDEAIKHDPKNAVAWNNKGAVLQSLGLLSDAIECFEKAAEIDPGSFDAHINLAKACGKLGRSDEAVVHYQRAHELRPESESAVEGLQKEFYRGMCLDQISGWAQLGLDTTYLRRVVDHDPENFEARSKEFLTHIAELETQLTVGSGEDRVDVSEAIKKIVKATEAQGATLAALERATGLRKEQLVLPIALLMKTDHLHFKTSGRHEVYVWKGKLPRDAPVRRKRPPAEPKEKPKEKPKEREKETKEEEEERLDTTASVLVFSRKR